MTVAELRKALEPFDGGQYVFVDLRSEGYPNGSQVIIQGVRESPPWHAGPPNLIGLVADARNREVKP